MKRGHLSSKNDLRRVRGMTKGIVLVQNKQLFAESLAQHICILDLNRVCHMNITLGQRSAFK